MPFLFINKPLWLYNLQTKTIINTEISVFVICVKATMYLLLYNLHDCTFKCFEVWIAIWMDTITNIFLQISRFAFYNFYVTMLREPIISSVVKNSWNWNFANFRDFNFTRGSHRRCSVLKNFTIFTGKCLCQSLFLSCNFTKIEALAKGFSCEFYKIFESKFFKKHLWMTASILISCCGFILCNYI